MRWKAIGAVGVIGGGLALWGAPGPVAEPAGTAVEPRRVVATPSAAPADHGGTGDTEGARRSHPERVRAVRSACGLAPATACQGDACASVVVVPDLDGVWGWAELVGSSPRFVATTILRDHGVPSRGMPCGAAIGSLLPADGAIGVDLPDGSEVWCAADDGARPLCDVLARGLLGPDAPSFSGRVRRLVVPGGSR